MGFLYKNNQLTWSNLQRYKKKRYICIFH